MPCDSEEPSSLPIQISYILPFYFDNKLVLLTWLITMQLAAQLVGRLLPEAATNMNVRKLLEQCDKEGMQHCALMPTAHCLHTPGGPLKVQN